MRARDACRGHRPHFTGHAPTERAWHRRSLTGGAERTSDIRQMIALNDKRGLQRLALGCEHRCRTLLAMERRRAEIVAFCYSTRAAGSIRCTMSSTYMIAAGALLERRYRPLCAGRPAGTHLHKQVERPAPDCSAELTRRGARFRPPSPFVEGLPGPQWKGGRHAAPAPRRPEGEAGRCRAVRASGRSDRGVRGARAGRR